MDLSRKTILIVGGTSGIGRATALKAAREGAYVVIAGRNREKGSAVCKEIGDAGGQAQFFRTDISLKVDVIALLEDISRAGRSVDIAINTASSDAGSGQALLETQDVDFDHLIEVNLKGIWMCTKFEIKHMREHKGGVVINVLPVNTLTGMHNASVFAATKTAIIAMTNSAALEEIDGTIKLYTLIGDSFPAKTIQELRGNDISLQGTFIMPARLDDTASMPSDVFADKILALIRDMKNFPSGSYFIEP